MAKENLYKLGEKLGLNKKDFDDILKTLKIGKSSFLSK